MEFSEIELPSNLKFGLFFSTVFAFLGFYLLYVNLLSPGYICLFLSTIFLCVALTFPSWLLPVNRFWMFTGYSIGKIINPIVMGFIFFGLITPISIFLRLSGRDELHLKQNKSGSQWRNKQTADSQLNSFKNQF